MEWLVLHGSSALLVSLSQWAGPGMYPVKRYGDDLGREKTKIIAARFHKFYKKYFFPGWDILRWQFFWCMLKHQPDGSPDLPTPHMEHQDEQFQFQTIRGLCGGYSMLERRDNIWFWWCVFLVRPLSHRHNKYQHVFLTIGPFFWHVTSSYLVACLKNDPQMTSEMTHMCSQG